ncbi:MAG TPA: hypothetical protein DCY20_02905, partial [Firmicutes bacterium]|nr:hypothetical protein [Bacillota bacterium]
MTYIKLNLAQLFNVSYMGQSKFDDDFKHFSRICDEYIFYFVKEGDLYIEEDGKAYHLTEGDYLILEPNKHHIGYKGAPVHYYFIHIKDADFSVVNGYSEAHIQEDIAKRRLTTLSSDMTTSTFKEDSVALIPKTYHLDQNFELYQLLDTACHELNQKNENYKLSAVLLSMQVLIKMNRLFNAQAAKGISQKAYATVKEVIHYL